MGLVLHNHGCRLSRSGPVPDCLFTIGKIVYILDLVFFISFSLLITLRIIFVPRVAQVFPPPCRVVFLRRLLDLHQPHSLGCKYLWRTLLRTLAYQGARGLLLTLQGSSFTSCYVRVSYAFHHGATADIPNSSFPHGFYQSIHFSWPAHSLAYPSRCLRSGTFVSPPSQ